ncbi:MAG: hypothetical protein GXP29_06550 [Planctomycetes bacterium]|nr:hypothetical protein [Planctomycetota bacterium]
MFRRLKKILLFKIVKGVSPFAYIARRPLKIMPRGAWVAVRDPFWPVYIYFALLIVNLGISVLTMIQLQNTTTAVPRIVSAGMAGFSFLFVGSMALLWVVVRNRANRFREHVEAAEYGVCLNCAYALRGLPDEHRCPECGSEYSMVNVRAVWKEWFAR